MIKDLAIADIRIDGGTQQRPLDENVVSRYRALVEDGTVFPPIDVVQDGNTFFLWDGYHRLEVYRKLNKKYISANIEPGTKREAIWFSFHANHKHGFPRQPGTVKEIVSKILTDEEWSKVSQAEIARWVGVTQQFISKMCKETKAKPIIQPSCSPDAISTCDFETGEVTQTNMTDSEGESEIVRSKKVEVKRGDQTYEMAVKGVQPVVDSIGEVVPEHLIPIFSRENEIKDMIRTLNTILKTAKDAMAHNDPLWKYCCLNPLEVHIKNVTGNLRATLPHAVCRYCGGDGKGCRACRELGFMNSLAYRTTADELKKKE
jgi:hypothetical protein